MREETEYRPKPMVEVGSRPLLWHIMRLFGHHGLNRFVLCLGYKGSMIRNYFLNYQAMTSAAICLPEHDFLELRMFEPLGTFSGAVSSGSTGADTPAYSALHHSFTLENPTSSAPLPSVVK
jgi:glucose-1-phosphate cytidylyltransferase